MMEPVFIYFDEVECDERNRFTLKFSNDEEDEATNYILFSKNKGYYKSDCNWTRTHNHLVHKRTLNHLAKLAK